MLAEFTEVLEKRKYQEPKKKNRDDDEPKKKVNNFSSNRDDRNNKGKKSGFGNIDLVRGAMDRFITSKLNPVDELSLFTQKMAESRFPDKLTDAIKQMDKEGSIETDGPVLGAMIFDILSNNRGKFRGELEDAYITIIDKLIRSRAEELSDRIKKKHRPSKDILKEIAVAVPSDDFVTDRKNIYGLVGEVNARLYIQAESWFPKGKDGETGEFTTKGLTKLFEAIYGEDNINKVAVGCLLEKRESYSKISTAEGKRLWNALSEFATETLEAVEDKRELDRLLGEYTYTRYLEFETDSGRRVILRDIDEEQQPNLAKAVKRLSKDERIAGRLA